MYGIYSFVIDFFGAFLRSLHSKEILSSMTSLSYLKGTVARDFQPLQFYVSMKPMWTPGSEFQLV
jgi:hypothetical protein